MTKFIAKFSSWLSAFAVLLCTAALAGDLKVSYENTQPCVPGVTGYSQAVIDLYVTTGADIGMVTFTATVTPVEGVTFDPTKVVWDTDTIDTTNAPTATTLSSGKLQLKINAPAPLTAAVQPSAEPQRICTVYFDVESTLAGSTPSLAFDITAATGVQGTKSVTKNNWLSSDSISAVEFNVYQSFNFSLVKGATFETDEDTALTISAADSTKFEATAWDGSALSATTAVEFASAELDNSEAGTIAVVNGELVFTPAENWNGDVNVSAVAKSTEITGTDTAVEFAITVNPVDDPLVVEWESQELVGVEGDAVSGTFTLTATDVDGDKFLTGATVTLGDDFLTVEGTLEQQGSQGGVTTYLFTATGPVVPYTAVAHPSTSWDCPLTVVATDGTTEYELTGTVKIQDTDQQIASVDFTVNGASELSVKADATLEAVGEATDPDAEDEATVEVNWSTDGQTWSTTQPTLVKGTTVYAKGVATSSYALKSYSVDSNVVTITVENTAPEVPVTNGSVFVLRHEDASTPEPGVTTFTATDVDGLDDLRLSVTTAETRAAEPAASDEITIDGQYGSAVVKLADGTITFTYTMYDTTVTANVDTQEELKFSVTDVEEQDFTDIAVNCVFQANPPPVLTAEATTVTIAEVDEAGNATSFEVTVTATDTNVYPAGVSAWAIAVPDGWTAEAGEQTTGSVEEGTWTGSATWTVTTAGYDTITGAPRAASEDFTVTVSATDAATGADATLDFTATVTDVDRLPSAPTTVALEPAEPVFGDALKATASGATDEDGDEITGYAYKWSYSADGENFTDLDETSDTLDNADAVKKGNTVKVAAFAVNAPYDGATATSTEFTEATVVVGNTAPYFSTLGDQTTEDATAALAYTWTVAENSESNAMSAVATDVDVDDTLTYSVGEVAETVGTLAIDAATGEITFTPAADYNTVETGDTVTFTVAVTDGTADATNTATVTLVITEANSAPSLSIADQYVLPGDLGTEMTVTATAEMGENEDAQSISEANIEVTENADDIFATAPAVSFSGKDVTVTYTVKEDAALGATAKVKVTIKDDGTTAGAADPQEATAEFTVFLGASPWYPLLSFECADPENHTEGHTVVLDGSDGSSYSITLKGDATEVLPADYVAIGHPGYEPNTELTMTVYVWTQKGGTSTEVCATAEATVADYEAPAEASADGEAEVGENGWVTLLDISVPMAQKYTIEVKDENGKTTQTIGPVEFDANDEGMVIPTISGLKIQLTDAGAYTISVTGTNPAGETTAEDLLAVTVDEDSDLELAWNEGSFVPENGAVLTNASVKFSWPVASGAKSYTLNVFNADGTQAASQKVSGTSQNVTLKMKAGEATPYTWSVTAVNGSLSLASDEFSFTLCESTDSVIITKVAAVGDGLEVGYAGTLDEGISVNFDYQYFDVSAMKWFNGSASGDPAEDGVLAVALSGVETEAGDYVVLQLKVNGKKQGDWVVYQIQETL